MTTKNNTRPGAATLGRAKAGNAVTGNIPLLDCTTPSQPAQASVFEQLSRGEENAIRSTELSRLCGFKSVRELQSAIAKERETGALILSTCRHGGGYYRPSDGEAGKREINAFVATLASRAINTLRAIKAARRELKTIDGQISIDEIEAALMAVVNTHDDGDR